VKTDPSHPPYSFAIDPFTWRATAEQDPFPYFIALSLLCTDKRKITLRGNPQDLDRLLRQALEEIHAFAGVP